MKFGMIPLPSLLPGVILPARIPQCAFFNPLGYRITVRISQVTWNDTTGMLGKVMSLRVTRLLGGCGGSAATP
jgi:hypothetical protein